MITMPMIYVLPLTGPDQGLGRICLVCKAQSAPAVAAFVSPTAGQGLPASHKTLSFIDAIQSLCDKHETLQGTVIIQAQPEMVITSKGDRSERVNEEFKNEMKSLVGDRRITILLASLPLGGLPDSVPIDPASENTTLFFRHRQYSEGFTNMLTPQTRANMHLSSMFQQLDDAASRLVALS